MKGQGPPEDPHNHRPTAEEYEGAAECAGEAGLHIVRGDGVVALVRLGQQRHDKGRLYSLARAILLLIIHYTYLNKCNANRQAYTEVVYVSPFRVKGCEREQDEQGCYQRSHVDPIGHSCSVKKA